MIKIKILTIFFTLISFTFAFSNPKIDARSAILMDFHSGKILYEDDADMQIYPASMTKIMTSIVAFDLLKEDKIKLSDEVIISENAWRMSKSGFSSMFIMLNDKVTIEDLLKGIIIVSGNDSCVALAEGIAGTEGAFADMMNEKASEIGGQFNMAKKIPGKEEFYETLRYYKVMIEKYGVELQLNTLFEPSKSTDFDHVILASGIHPRTPNIDGIKHSKTVSYVDVLKDKVKLGKKVALMGAGGIGFDVAEYITHEGKSTALDTSAFMREWGVDMELDARGGVEGIKAEKPKNPREVYLLQRKSSKVGAGLGKTTGWVHRFTLRNKNVKMINGVEYKRIDDHGLHYTKKDKTTVLDVDHVVICAGQVSNTDLFEDIKKINPNVQLIGGAFKAAELDAKEAINQAVRMAAVI